MLTMTRVDTCILTCSTAISEHENLIARERCFSTTVLGHRLICRSRSKIRASVPHTLRGLGHRYPYPRRPLPLLIAWMSLYPRLTNISFSNKDLARFDKGSTFLVLYVLDQIASSPPHLAPFLTVHRLCAQLRRCERHW